MQIGKSDRELSEFYDTGQTGLYNLAEDIGEQHNLKATHPGKAGELLTQLQNWREHTRNS